MSKGNVIARSNRSDEGSWQEEWDLRLAGLEGLFGPASDKILTSPVPIYLGGGCDVLTFRYYDDRGTAYVTAGLTGTLAGQPPATMGTYELMMCVPSSVPEEDHRLIAGVLSGLAT